MYDILDSETIHKEYPLASKSKRLANYVIDLVFFYILAIIVGGVAGIVMAIMGSSDVLLEEDNTATDLVIQLIAFVVYVVYYTVCEHFFNGKTIGKLITRTRAVTIDDEIMTLGTAFKRSAIRLIPFEAFSFFGDIPLGWHDRWTQTKVILDKDWHKTDYI